MAGDDLGDPRDRLADGPDSLADERDRRADDRDLAADARDHAADEREAALEAREALVRLQDEQIAALVAEIDGLKTAMRSRAVIDQAKGVIMSTMGCSADAAFAVLVQQSSSQNRKLAEIAAELAGLQDRPPRI